MVGNTYFCNIHDFNGCKLPSSFVTTLDLLRKEIFKFVFHDFYYWSSQNSKEVPNITERSPSFPDCSIRVDHGHNHQWDESGFVCPVLIIIFKMLLSSTTEFWQRAKASKVSLRNSLLWSSYIINWVDKTTLSCFNKTWTGLHSTTKFSQDNLVSLTELIT